MKNKIHNTANSRQLGMITGWTITLQVGQNPS